MILWNYFSPLPYFVCLGKGRRQEGGERGVRQQEGGEGQERGEGWEEGGEGGRHQGGEGGAQAEGGPEEGEGEVW